MAIQMQLEVILPGTLSCEAEITKESMKKKTESGN